MHPNDAPHHPPEDATVTAMSPEAANFGWLLENFVKSVPGVQHTLVVSADGLLMAVSDDLDRTSGDQLSAIVAGLSSLTRGAARQLSSGEVRQSIVEMDAAFLFLMTISDGSVLAVVAGATCDVGLVGYEMALLVSRTESTLTPQLVSEMRANLPLVGPTRAGVGGGAGR
jgi:predicted regulator of Ras-like GTPase activity (Roadblock/LC7/MglB family)